MQMAVEKVHGEDEGYTNSQEDVLSCTMKWKRNWRTKEKMAQVLCFTFVTRRNGLTFRRSVVRELQHLPLLSASRIK
jgi:hypothetical protein